MKRIFKEAIKTLIAVLLGFVYMWFVLSFAWSLGDMSMAEKIMGVAYTFLMIPIYEGIKKLLRLS